MPTSRDYCKGDIRCHMWKRSENQKPLFTYCSSFPQADGTPLLMSPTTSMGQQRLLPPGQPQGGRGIKLSTGVSAPFPLQHVPPGRALANWETDFSSF